MAAAPFDGRALASHAAAGRPLGLVRADACENPREGGPVRTPYGSAGGPVPVLAACERAPGADEPPSAGQVLTHPTFDRPPVPNERRPGRKAGAVSLAAARRRKAAEGPVIEPAGTTPDRGRIAPPFRGQGAESPGATADLMRRGAEALDLDARGMGATDRAVIEAALAVLGRYLRTPGALFDSPGATRDFLRLHLAGWDRERFAVLFLDGQHRLIELEVMFEGTLTQTSVYPRDVARRALHWNAAAVILAHNHPSGHATPSAADQYLTKALRQALALVDTRVLDHLVIGWPDVVSLAEQGLM